MAVTLCGGSAGLWAYRDGWQRLPCPLPHPALLARSGAGLLVLDDRAQLLWDGRQLMPVPRGVEALLSWRGDALLLSGETDGVMRLSLATGQPLLVAPAGVYPQDACLMPGDVLAVCGGCDGTVRLLNPFSLRPLRTLTLPGITERIAWSGDALHVLCAVGNTAVRCQYWRIPRAGAPQCVALLPGLPGAVCGDARGGAWVAATETLCRFPAGALRPDCSIGGTGLVRHMVCPGGRLMTCDPVLGCCTLFGPGGYPAATWHGDVGQGLL